MNQTGGFNDEEGILPPGMELITTTVYGQLTISIDNILYLNSASYPSDEVRIRVKFWGEKGPGKIFRARNSNISLCDMYPCSRNYQVCCQMEQFYKYLEDMSKNNKLRATITDNVNKAIGYFTIDFLPYLKPSQGFNDMSPFDEIEFVYPIMSVKKDQQKIGEIKVFIDSSFDPNKSQFIRDNSEYNTQHSESRKQNFQDANQFEEERDHFQNKQNVQYREREREIFNNIEIDEGNLGNTQYDDSRIPNSLIEKKQQLEYQSNKFLENVPKKVNLGLELMEEIYNDNEDDEDINQIFNTQKQQQQQQNKNSNIFGQGKQGTLPKHHSQKEQSHPMRDQEYMNVNSNLNLQSHQNNRGMSIFDSQDNQQSNQQMQQAQKTTFQNQNFFIEQDNINSKLDKIIAMGENIFQMKQDLATQNPVSQNITENETLKKRNDISPIRQQIQSSVNSNKFEQVQQVSTAQFERGEDLSSDFSMQQSDFLKDEIEKQKQLIREQVQNQNQGSLLNKLSFKKKEEDPQRRQQNKSSQMVEYNLPKVNDINKEFNEQDQKAVAKPQEIQKEIPQQAPINLEDIKQSESLELNILEFNCLHDHLLAKFKQRNIFIACTIPSIFKSASGGAEDFSLEDSYKQLYYNCRFILNNVITFCREVNGEEFIFRQKFTLSIEISDENFQRINSSSIQFTLNSFILPQKEVQDQRRIMMQIANGEFKMNKLFEQKSLGGNFYINMFTTLPVDSQKHENQSEKAIVMKVSKQELEKNKQQNNNLLGQVKISVNLIIKKKFNKGLQGSSQQSNIQFNKTGVQQIGGSQTIEQGLSYSQAIPSALFNNFQILLRIGKLKVLNIQQYTSYNFFARYKIYGTIEQVSSEIQWDNIEPDLHHRLTMPCSLDNVQKMLKIPFILEVWNKSEKGEDQIVGIIKINMSSIPKTILLPDFSGVNPNFLQSQQSQLLIVCNESMSVNDLAENKDKGILFVTIAFGSPLQISKFDTNLNQSHLDYYHSMHQRSQHNSSFYTNNSLKPPLTGQRNMNAIVDQHNQNIQSNRQLLQNQQGQTQTIHVSNLYDRSKQFSSAQKSQTHQLNSTENINYKSEDKRMRGGQSEIEYDDEDIRQHSLTIKPEAQILQSSKSQKNYEDEYEIEGNTNSNLMEKFVEIMQLLNQNMHRIQAKLKKFVLSCQAKDAIENKEFIEFLQSLEIGIKLGDILPLVRLFDSQKEGSFKFEYFSKSFNSFQRYEGQIRQKYQTVLQNLLEVIEASNMKPSDIDKELTRQSEFGLMRKEKFINIMKKLSLQGDNVYEMVESICTLLDVKNDGLLFVSTLNDYLASIDVYGEVKKLVLNHQWFLDIFQQDFSVNLINESNKKLSNPLEEAKQLEKEQLLYQKEKIYPSNLISFFSTDNSYWEILLLISIIKGKKDLNSNDDLTVNGEQVKTFLSAIKFQTLSSGQNIHDHPEQQSSNKSQQKAYEYSSNSKRKNIDINNPSQIDAFSNISQLGVSQMKKSATQKKQEQDELQLITDLLNDQVVPSNANNLFSQNKSKSNFKRKGEFEDDDEEDFQEIPTSDNNQNKKSQNLRKQIRDEFEDEDSFERQEKLIIEQELRSQSKQKANTTANKGQPKQEEVQQTSISQTLKKKKFKVVHKFTVNIHKIISANLGKEYDMENALLFYQFGDQERVQIGSFDYFYGQSKYDVNYQGEKIYKLNNEDDLENILIQENVGISIDFEVSKSKQNVGASYVSSLRQSNIPIQSQDRLRSTANLSSYILLDIISSSSSKNDENGDSKQQQPFIVEQSINLINYETQQSVGKVQLSITYQVKEQVVEVENIDKSKQGKQAIEEECLLEKETKVKTLLPKHGYLNLTLSAACTFKQHEIEWKNYKIVLFCDLFHENSYLSTIFKSLNSSASYNMAEEVLTIQENYQINLSQEIINYLQDNTCLIQLRIFPLDDLMRRSNHVVLGELFLNLQYLLIKQEINEECLTFKRSQLDELEEDSKSRNENDNIPSYPISSSRESVGICSVQITYTKEKQFMQSNSSLIQLSKEMKNKSIISNPLQKEIPKNNFHQLFVLFDEILSLIEYDSNLISDQMCFFRTKINGQLVEGKDSFKMNFLEMKLHELQGETYLQFLVQSEDLQFINPLNIDLVIRDMNKQQSEEIVLGHISIDFEQLRKEFFQNLLENNSMKCIKSSGFTLIRRNQLNHPSKQNEAEQSIQEVIMNVRVNLRLLLVKYETKGDQETCQQFLQQLILSNLSKNINASGSTDILQQLRISLRYSRQDFDTILNYLTFDKQTLFALLNIKDSHQIESRDQKCALLQNECQQLIEDILIYDKNESGIVDIEDLKKVLRKYSPSLREKASSDFNKLDRNSAKIEMENVGKNVQKCDYLQFLKDNYILSTIQRSQESQQSNYQLKLKIEKATNVSVLFNGVVPNTYVKCVQFEITTTCILRDLNPQFDHSYEIDLKPSEFKNYHSVKFVLYHRGYNSDFRDNMYKSVELGTATLDLSKLFFTKTKEQSKQELFKLKIEGAHYSARVQNDSYLFVNVQLNGRRQQLYEPEYNQREIKSYNVERDNQFVQRREMIEQEIPLKQETKYEGYENQNNDDDNLLYNDEAFNNFQQTLMEMRQQNEGQEEDQITDSYDHSKQGPNTQNIYERSSNQYNQKNDEDDYLQTLPKSRQFGVSTSSVKDQYEQKDSDQKYKYGLNQYNHENDNSDLMLEKAMNDIDDIKREFNSEEKDYEYNYSKKYEDRQSLQKDKTYEIESQKRASQQQQYEDIKPRFNEEKYEYNNQKKDIYGSEDELEDLRRTLQQLNQTSETGQVVNKNKRQDLDKEDPSSMDKYKYNDNQNYKEQPFIARDDIKQSASNIQNFSNNYLQKSSQNDGNYQHYSKYTSYLDNKSSQEKQQYSHNQNRFNHYDNDEDEDDQNYKYNNKNRNQIDVQFNQNKLTSTYQQNQEESDNDEEAYTNIKRDELKKNNQFENFKQTRDELKNNYETFKPVEKQSIKLNTPSQSKPPIKRSDSQNSLKKLEKKILPQSMIDSAEAHRISNILKQDFTKERKYFDDSSDDD